MPPLDVNYETYADLSPSPLALNPSRSWDRDRFDDA